MELKSFIKASAVTLLVIVLMAFMSVVSFAEETTPTWESKANMSIARSYVRTAAVNGKLYAIGVHYNDDNPIGLVEEYDPMTNKWSVKTPMPTARTCFAIAVYSNKIYVIGGAKKLHLDSSYYTNVVEIYDPSTDTWSVGKPALNEAAYTAQAVALNGKIYMMGGRNSYNIDVYDISTDTWETKGTIPYKKMCAGLVSLNNKLYFFGGSERDMSPFYDTIYEYDPTTNILTLKKSMPISKQKFGYTVLDGKIIVAGGETSSRVLTNSVEIYDPAKDSWTQGTNLSTQRMFFDLCTLNGNIYAVGGYSNTGALNNMDMLSSSSNTTNPTFTATASATKTKIGDEFTTDIAIHNVTNICAEDIKITYDSNLFEYVGATDQTGLKIYKEDTSTPGTVRFIVACQGKDNVATGDKNLIQLKFKAKSRGVGKVDIIKGRIADNATLEMDVADENCGEATIEVGGKDVNRTDTFTLLDLGIDAYYFGFNATDTDTTKYDADLDSNGKIDDGDLTSITESILLNKDYPLN